MTNIFTNIKHVSIIQHCYNYYTKTIRSHISTISVTQLSELEQSSVTIINQVSKLPSKHFSTATQNFNDSNSEELHKFTLVMRCKRTCSSPPCLFPRRGWWGDRCGVSPPRRPCTGPTSPLGCPSRRLPSLPVPGSAPRLSPPQPGTDRRIRTRRHDPV